MQSILDKTTRDQLLARVNKLNENCTAKWGKMTVYQMVQHCAMWEEMLLGKKIYKQSLLGKIFGKFALKDMMQDKPMKPNLPTVPSFKMKGTGDLNAEKAKWIELIKEHATNENHGIVHPFFGKLTADEAGRIAFKHVDHHLKQFNC